MIGFTFPELQSSCNMENDLRKAKVVMNKGVMKEEMLGSGCGDREKWKDLTDVWEVKWTGYVGWGKKVSRMTCMNG